MYAHFIDTTELIRFTVISFSASWVDNPYLKTAGIRIKIPRPDMMFVSGFCSSFMVKVMTTLNVSNNIHLYSTLIATDLSPRYRQG